MKYQIKQNLQFGYHEVDPKPSREELRQYYADKYYQNESASYSHTYEEEERRYFNAKIAQKKWVLEQLLSDTEKGVKSLLDIGCGEGFTLDFFQKHGWNVWGIDFSDFGISNLHPDLLSCFQKGDISESIDALIQQGKKFHVVWLDNVLEHVVNPQELLLKARELTMDGGALVIEVPNDFNRFQLELLQQKKVTRRYWEAYPDHLVYFTRSSLISLCSASGWAVHKVLADFPIEWFLLNQHSNYCEDRSVGKQAHAARVFLENFLEETVSERTQLISFY